MSLVSSIWNLVTLFLLKSQCWFQFVSFGDHITSGCNSHCLSGFILVAKQRSFYRRRLSYGDGTNKAEKKLFFFAKRLVARVK